MVELSGRAWLGVRKVQSIRDTLSTFMVVMMMKMMKMKRELGLLRSGSKGVKTPTNTSRVKHFYGLLVISTFIPFDTVSEK